jgi:hypothetical protein
MYLRQSDATASLQLSSQRKRDLLDHFEARGGELDRWRRFNAAYHEDDLKFMRFLIPPGKRVLEPGCGRGDLLAALEPSYGVGIDFGAAKQNLKIIETPIHYKARTFGETQISRFRDGWLLLKMVWFAYRKLKAI